MNPIVKIFKNQTLKKINVIDNKNKSDSKKNKNDTKKNTDDRKN